MINELLFVHHSHTDIGYTHPQPVVMELHRRFIDEALDIAERTADYPDDSRFRWTCEVTGITIDWWKSASNVDRDRFLSAVKRGQIEVAGMGWHMTPLMDHSMVVDVLQNIRFFRDLGIPVRSAMNTDVNGLPWGIVDSLLDHGVTGISMAINEHYGHALSPWPRAFNWQSPSGRTITAYNGFIYGATSESSIRVPVDLEEAIRRVPKWAKRWSDSGYPHSFLMMQLTNIRYLDNASPQAGLPDFINAFNERSAETGVKLRNGTLSEFFDRLRAEPAERLPTWRGDWTDWWNFGAGSTAGETAQALRGQRDLDAARASEAWFPAETVRRRDALHAKARESLTLFAEHTWGADRSIRSPHSPETRTQQLLKLATAAEGASLARMLRRDGLERLAIEAGGEEPRVLLFNPHPYPVTQSVRLPFMPPLANAPTPDKESGLEGFVPTGPFSHRIQRQDVVFSDLPDSAAFWTAPVSVPGLSYVTIAADRIGPADTATLSATENTLGNAVISVSFGKNGGVETFSRDGEAYTRSDGDLMTLGIPVLEEIESGFRTDQFDVVDMESPDWNIAWHRDWKARRQAGVLEETTAAVEAGAASVSKRFAMASGETVTVIYRVLADDPALYIEARVDKKPIAAPQSIYLPLPVAVADKWDAHYETGGAVTKLDDEQLPYASRHYITAQRFLRIADAEKEVTVACPDVPLWQAGGYTFGRFEDPDGSVLRDQPALLAWLTNNYWSTNFQADQSGLICFKMALLPSRRRSIGASARDALARVQPLAAHVYAGRGAVSAEAGSLLDLDLGDLLLTRIEADGEGVALTILNPGDEPGRVRVSAGHFRPATARRTTLAGEPLEELSLADGAVSIDVEPRAWTRISLRPA